MWQGSPALQRPYDGLVARNICRIGCTPITVAATIHRALAIHTPIIAVIIFHGTLSGTGTERKTLFTIAVAA